MAMGWAVVWWNSVLSSQQEEAPPVLPPREKKDELHSRDDEFPWRLYDAFLRRADGCGVATFVAQYEGDCGDQYEVMEVAAHEAGYTNASKWLEAARAKDDECVVCKLSEWETVNLPLMERQKKDRLERYGGPTRTLRCEFGDKVVPARMNDAYHNFASTLIFECQIPMELQTCEPLDVVVANDDRSVRARVSVHDDTPSTDVAACTWTSAGAFRDRNGNLKTGLNTEQLTAWLAAHLVFGVGYFLIFESDATWWRREDSALWPAVAPLYAMGKADLIPWPSHACGKDGDGPWASFSGPTQRAAFSAQSFFGRPSQYAAQNSCHRRLQGRAQWIAHLDVDEFAIPGGNSSLVDAIALYAGKKKIASLGLPHLFYGACDSSQTRLFQDDEEDGTAYCAGKAVSSRVKQIASAMDVEYVWDHYVRLRTPGTTLVTARAVDLRLAHARAGYGFSDAATARFATVVTPADIPKREKRLFDTKIRPRLRSLNCSLTNDTTLCGKRIRDPFCWCRDHEIDRWRPQVAAMRRRTWGGSS